MPTLDPHDELAARFAAEDAANEVKPFNLYDALKWRPTHIIRFFYEDSKGRSRTDEWAVMVVADEPGGGGPAYTESEWRSHFAPEWMVYRDGSATCAGEDTPYNADGYVEVEKLP